MPEKISIMRESGETLSSNIVAIFTIPDTEKHYVITTENAVDPHGLTVLHVSENVDGVLKKIATDDEWATIKTIMRSIISGSAGSFKYEPLLTTIKAEAQYSRDISVSASASKQIIDSYMASLQESGEEGNSSEEVVLEDVNEITPGISEVVSENVEQPKVEEVVVVPEAPVAPPVVDSVPVVETDVSVSNENSSGEEIVPVISDGAPSNGTIVLNTVSEEVPTVSNNVVAESVPVEEKAEDIIPVDSTAVVDNVSGAAPTIVTEKVVVHEPVVAYVDPAFQQLLTNDYNQMLMCVQNIQNMISQVAAMPALNYQPSYNMNSNGVPNFNPNASVDEIISGSTEVFAEGVKNLVATITEKMYRDLFEREADLKRREELLLQRETMLNNQMAALANLAQPMAQPVVQEEVSSEPVVEVNEEVQQGEQQVLSEQPVVEVQPQAVESQSVVEQQPMMEQQPVEQQVEQSIPEEGNSDNQGINVVQAQVKIETPVDSEEKVVEEVVETTVPAQQNTAPVAEPVSPEAEVAEEAVPVAEAIPVAEAAAPITNTVPQPVQTVEIV